MAKQLTRWFNQHEFPELYYRFPNLVTFQWFGNRILFHRSWLIRKTVKNTLRQFRTNLSYLDAGCGVGDFMIPFARKYPDGHFEGLDKSPGNIRLLENYCTKKHLSHVKLVTGDIQELRSSNRFSVVLIASVFHLLTDRYRVYKILNDNMISGDRLIIYVPVNHR